MPRYVLMTRLSPDALHDAETRRTAGRQWMERVKDACPEVEWIGHYALLGPWDFMDLYDAPDAETAQKVSLLSRAEGAVAAESWQALPYERYLKALEDISR
ncbi:MAG TPA: GYD domain-containing protein [Candidatus Krumholzibacteria bacterium]|nr:GYD domain-containing protein [Candidatus Krumholzibacteria bacterium]